MLKRLFIVGLVSGGLFVASGFKPADAYVTVDVNLRFGTGHSFYFEREPYFVPVPHSHIYYAAHDECDIYRYGDWYYVNNGADWYRARGFRGPFVRIAYVSVPQSIVVVPTHYRRFAGRYWSHDPWKSRWKGRAVQYDRDVRYGRNHRHERNDHYARNDGNDRDDRHWRDRDGGDRGDDRRWSNNDDRRDGKGKGNGKNKGKGKKNGHGNSARGHGRG